jgi:hypothetical protein
MMMVKQRSLLYPGDFGKLDNLERKKMKRKNIEKRLSELGYTLKRTSDTEARWMIRSDVLTYHWNFRDLKSVERFMVDERAMYRYAKENGAIPR